MSGSLPVSLSTLSSHSIFLSPSSSCSTEDDWELVDRPTEPDNGQKTNRMAMREKDLFVAVGKEVRMSSLGGEEGWEVKDGKVGSYKASVTSYLTWVS